MQPRDTQAWPHRSALRTSGNHAQYSIHFVVIAAEAVFVFKMESLAVSVWRPGPRPWSPQAPGLELD